MRSDFSLNKSVIDLSNANPACGHKDVRRSTGHIMVTTRNRDPNRVTESLPGPTTREHRKHIGRQDDVFGYGLQFLVSGVLPVCQNLNYRLQKRLSGVLLIYQTKSSQMTQNVF